jgi:hypothetical protein
MSRPSMDKPGSLSNGDSSHSTLNGEMLNGLDTEPTVAIDSAPAAAKATKKGKQSGSSVEQELREKLEQANADKETLESQYRTLLDRLSEMKSKIGLKLQQDAVGPFIFMRIHRADSHYDAHWIVLRSIGGARTTRDSHNDSNRPK